MEAPAHVPDQAPKHDASDPITGLNKRQQVAKTNKAIFIWVAVASTVIALVLVALQFLIKEGLFNQSIINQKQQTNQTLEQNIENANELKKNVDNLIADTSLAKVRAKEGDTTLQVILDALPTTGDPVTFSNSLVNRILPSSAVSIQSVAVGDSALGVGSVVVEPQASSAASPVSGQSPTPQPLIFTVGITGNPAQIKDALAAIERTIRPISVSKLIIKAEDTGLNASIGGETYYVTASKVELGKVSKKP